MRGSREHARRAGTPIASPCDERIHRTRAPSLASASHDRMMKNQHHDDRRKGETGHQPKRIHERSMQLEHRAGNHRSQKSRDRKSEVHDSECRRRTLGSDVAGPSINETRARVRSDCRSLPPDHRRFLRTRFLQYFPDAARPRSRRARGGIARRLRSGIHHRKGSCLSAWEASRSRSTRP